MYSSRIPVLCGGAIDCIALCLSDRLVGPNGRSCETYGIIVVKDTVSSTGTGTGTSCEYLYSGPDELSANSSLLRSRRTEDSTYGVAAGRSNSNHIPYLVAEIHGCVASVLG